MTIVFIIEGTRRAWACCINGEEWGEVGVKVTAKPSRGTLVRKCD